MKRLLILLIFLCSILLVPLVYALTCSIKTTCGTGEVCVFSVYGENNTHVGKCGYYSYNLCCDLTSSEIRDTCLQEESPILSLYRENNTHIGLLGYYTKVLCVKPKQTCSVRTSCEAGETAIISIYRNDNTHIGAPSYYTNKLCCKPAGIGIQTYGENVTGKNVGCYEVPYILQNLDGSIRTVTVKVCVWK